MCKGKKKSKIQKHRGEPYLEQVIQEEMGQGTSGHQKEALPPA